MTKVIASFENQTVYVGLDVYKAIWNTAIYLNDQFVRNIHQPPTPQALFHYLQRIYPPRQDMFVPMNAASLDTGTTPVSGAWCRMPGSELG